VPDAPGDGGEQACADLSRRNAEEFIEAHDDSIRRPQESLHHLANYLWLYNSERIHSSLAEGLPGFPALPGPNA